MRLARQESVIRARLERRAQLRRVGSDEALGVQILVRILQSLRRGPPSLACLLNLRESLGSALPSSLLSIATARRRCWMLQWLLTSLHVNMSLRRPPISGKDHPFGESTGPRRTRTVVIGSMRIPRSRHTVFASGGFPAGIYFFHRLFNHTNRCSDGGSTCGPDDGSYRSDRGPVFEATRRIVLGVKDGRILVLDPPPPDPSLAED